VSNSHTRQCKSCLETFDIKNFANAGVKGGKAYYRHICRTCHGKNVNERRLVIRAIFVEWKKTLTCSKCGFDDHRALHFHHHDGNKEANIADLVSNGAGIDTIQKEAAKCIVLCANCHAIEHAS
jgi:hypothetical protein